MKKHIFSKIFQICTVILYEIAIILLLFNITTTFATTHFDHQKIDTLFKDKDLYIRTNATKPQAKNILSGMLIEYDTRGKWLLSYDLLQHYQEFFPKDEEEFKIAKSQRLNQILAQYYQEEYERIYFALVNEYQNTSTGVLLVKKYIELDINKRMWKDAIHKLRVFQVLYPNYRQYFNDLDSILSANDENLEINQIGNSINTKGSEWDPNPTPDGKYLFFSAEGRDSSFGNADIYFSEMKDGKWLKPQNLGSTINSGAQETIDNVTLDGNGLMLSGIFSGGFGQFDIFYAERTQEGWGGISHYPQPINTQYVDEGGYLTSDRQALIFTSDRPGGIGAYKPYGTLEDGNLNGNMDIYVCLMTQDGWSKPINLGKTINTEYSERSPFLHPDGKTLYFSSNGHPGIGGLDVFKSVRLSDTSWTEWSKPVNLGKEINTIADDWGYKVGINGDSAFFAAQNRTIGVGNWDLFSVKLPKNVQPEKVITIYGKVKDTKGNPISCKIKWEDLKTNKLLGEVISNPKTGEYFIALPYGKFYGYFAEKEGYYPSSKNIDLTKKSIKTKYEVNITLKTFKNLKIDKESITINNIFFDYDKFELKTESQPELNRLIDFLKVNSVSQIIIEGHTDDIGSDGYNLILSEKRAKSVSEYLTSKGISNSKIKTKGYGRRKPIAENDTDEGRASNRRVEVKLFDK